MKILSYPCLDIRLQEEKSPNSSALAEPAWLWDFPEAQSRKETENGIICFPFSSVAFPVAVSVFSPQNTQISGTALSNTCKPRPIHINMNRGIIVIFSCPKQLNTWPCHSLTDSLTLILLLTYKKRPQRPVTFETIYQSDEETWRELFWNFSGTFL